MKFILEERDENTINNINKDLEDGIDIPLFINKKGSKYYLEFECTDIAKANVFALNMMNPNSEMHQYIIETLGIDITAFSYNNPADRELENVKLMLRETLDRLEHL